MGVGAHRLHLTGWSGRAAMLSSHRHRMTAPTALGARFLHRAPRGDACSTNAAGLFRHAPKTRWTGIVLGVFVLLIVALFLIFFDWNYFKPTLARLISEKTGRPTVIEGKLKVHVWSWNPSAEVDGLTMKNPPGREHDVMFHADRLIVSVSLGRLLRGQLVLPQVEVVRPTVDLERDAKGRASWEFGDASGRPQTSAKPAKIPTIRRLLIEDGKVRVDDQDSKTHSRRFVERGRRIREGKRRVQPEMHRIAQ